MKFASRLKFGCFKKKQFGKRKFHSSNSLLRNILVCLDGSKYSEQAFQVATDTASKEDLLILYNVPEVLIVNPKTSFEQLEVMVKQSLSNSQKLLDEFEKKASEKGIFSKKVIADQFGGESAQIVDAVEKHKVDLLFMGSKGKNALQRFMIGSTSDYCAHHCNTTVCIVKEKKEK